MVAPKVNSNTLLLIVALLLLLLTRRKDGEPPPGDGPAVPGGAIGSVNVSQVAGMGNNSMRRRALRMASHLAPKLVGDPVTVEFTWTPLTTQNGIGIPWNYASEFEVISPGEGVVQSGGLHVANNVPSGGPRALTVVIPSQATGKTGNFHFKVKLLAMSSSPEGLPQSPYVQVAESQHNFAIAVNQAQTLTRAQVHDLVQSAWNSNLGLDVRWYVGVVLQQFYGQPSQSVLDSLPSEPGPSASQLHQKIDDSLAYWASRGFPIPTA